MVAWLDFYPATIFNHPKIKKMTLHEIKTGYAGSLGMSWNDMIMDRTLFDSVVDEIAKRYAAHKLKEAEELCDDYEDRRGEHATIISQIKLD